MNLSDIEKLNILELRAILRSDSLPAGTRVRWPVRADYSWDRLFVCFNTKTTQTWEHGCVTVQDSDVVLIPKNMTYTDYYIEEGYSIIAHIDLSPDIPDGIYRWSFQDKPEIKQRFLTMEALWKQKKTAYYSQCMRELYTVLGMIIRLETARYTNTEKVSVIMPAVEYMKANYQDAGLAIPSLASMCGISYSYFRRLFYDVYGISANDYLLKLRLDNACLILSLGNYSISQTAHMTGFTDVYYFSSFFKKHIGISPGEYQKRHIQKN